MIRHEESVEKLLQSRLRPARLPAAEEAWRDVRGAIIRHAARRRRQRMLVQLAAVLVLSLLATTGLTLAASPELREYLDLHLRATMAGGQIKDGRLRSLYPAPKFTVFQPTELPDGMYLVTYGFRPEPVEIGPVALAQPEIRPATVSRLDGRDIPRDIVKAVHQRGSELLDEAREPTLVLIYAATPERVVELPQRPAAGRSLPSGEPTEVRGRPAVVTRGEGRDVVTWIEHSTLVEVHTTLGRAAALRVANGLEVTRLVPFETTQAGQDLLSPRPAPPTVPLAQRVEAVTVPRVDPAAVAERCGRWDADLYPPSARQTTEKALRQAANQAFCLARVVAGVDDVRGGWGTSRPTWREAVERLGLDPAIGPGGNPTVWSVQFEVSPGAGGYVVILDAESGEPYLLVRLKPLP